MIKINNKWDPKDQILYLEEFLDLYNNRPIKDNTGGMKSAHMFNSWYVIKKLKPKYIIESGIWKGQGTWFFEKASPESHIICIDPMPQYREITIPKAQYITNDFTVIDWAKSLDTSEALVFFDDHQSCINRIQHCVNQKFIHIMFEDNYPYDQGDCYSPKKILSQKEYVIDRGGDKSWFQPSLSDFETLQSSIEIYQEMPPIFSDAKTRWGCDWLSKYETPNSLLSSDLANEYELFYEERLDYTWICYIELIQNAYR